MTADWFPELTEIAVVELPVSFLEAADSPRLRGIDEEHALALAESDSSLPPIMVHRPTMRIIDGMHRVQAARIKGCDTVPAIFFDGSDAEAYVLSVKINTRHGLPLSRADRRAAVARVSALYPQWSDRAIAEMVGVSPKTVGTIRSMGAGDVPSNGRRVGRDGRVRPLNSALGRERIRMAIASDPGASLRQLAEAAGVSPNTVRRMRKTIQSAQDTKPGDETGPAAVTDAPAPQVRQTDSVAGLPSPRAGSDQLPLCVSWALLSRDPSLRSTEAGRLLLRGLSMQSLGPETWERLSNSIPAHRISDVAQLARQCADTWHTFAQRLEVGTRK
ncbi:ParB N-terminal domain-containing protein [Streptomyces caniscabiei]|nr:MULTISPECIES: ParB N-terminal domain-containing protein [Streptomyces]MBE4741322.1 ParB N-terminal domain-containing protein [Streptomyces caniscabiei]MDX2990620.1 ParB N-terminal domain-containing protein [Streptomyces caniscabiei]